MFFWSYISVLITSPGGVKQNFIDEINRQNSGVSANSDTQMLPGNQAYDGPPPLVPANYSHGAVQNTHRIASEISIPMGAYGFTGATENYRIVETNRTGQIRYCNKCEAPKPDRTHHCSVCQKCVLAMDHHCPWTFGCIGFNNRKFFYLFIFYTAVYCTFVAATLLSAVIEGLSNSSTGFFQFDFQILSIFFIAGVFGLTIIGFTGVHTHLILVNKTTIENLEGARKIRGEDGSVYYATKENVYDCGARSNWRLVMGNNPLLWFIPVKSSIGDGHTFPINQEAYNNMFSQTH
ncbi:hypothetical protein HK098_000672 [Nowakowskiella sp. JEL0407]|nr:hypothetical protein HK098_000672 [Nowakowskiella sp. JEL0407]